MKSWLPCLAVLAGCGSTPTPSTDAGPADAGPPVVLRGCDPRLFADAPDASVSGPGETYDYVINRLIVDDQAEPGYSVHAVSGFDLDDRRSPNSVVRQAPADCSHGDYFSTLDPDQNDGRCVDLMHAGGTACSGGVDNQLPNAFGTIAQFGTDPTGAPLLDQQINGGHYSVLVRVAGVHGALGPTLDDPDVTIRVYPVAWPTFPGCDRVQQAGQVYAVDDRSLRRAGDLDAPVMEYPGCIVHGRLRQREVTIAGAPTPMELPLVGDARVPLHDLQLRFDLGEQAASHGNLGATAVPTEVTTVLLPRAPASAADNLSGLVLGFVDLPLPADPMCRAPGGFISVGLGFTALRANVQAATVTGPVAGACGAP